MEFQKISREIFDPTKDNMERFSDTFGEQLTEMFPTVVKDGEVDFKALLAELGKYVDSNERFELNWAGKTDAKRLANTDIVGRTLKYVPEESQKPESTENLYIEGDNLEVLKLLRNSYYNKIKMIYIDPPYNTGNDFVYKDDFVNSENNNAIIEGEMDEEGNRLIVNQKSSGRYHSNWLNMMYPRLKVARDLLNDDGVIFISIDDNEVDNLKKICDEIFGISCFIANAIWRSTDNSNNDAKQFSCDHNYTLIYAKNSNWQPAKISDDSKRSHFKNPDNNPRGPYFDGNPLNSPNYRENLIYDIISPQGIVIKPPKNGWRWSKGTLDEKIKTEEIRFTHDGTAIRRRTYLCDMKGLPPSSLWIDLDTTGHNRQAKYELLKIIPEDIFDTPKPIKLIRYILQLANVCDDDIILDFFSGSATTAHAVMQLNAEDGDKRRFIMVQIPELCDEKSEAFKAGFNNICEIGKERIRRAGEKILKDYVDNENVKNLDVGFKVFRVGDTNIRWFSEAIKSNTVSYEQLTLKDKNMLDFNPGYTDVDVVCEILLRHRDIPLSAKVEQLTEIGNRTYIFVSTVVVCLEDNISDTVIDEIASIEPLPTKIIFRDSAFGADISLKENSMLRLEAQMKRHSGQEKRAYRVEFI